METILVKIFATALALSQITTTPDAVKTQFDRVRDQEQVAQLLHAGWFEVAFPQLASPGQAFARAPGLSLSAMRLLA